MDRQHLAGRTGLAVFLLTATLSPPDGRAFRDGQSFEAAAITHHSAGTPISPLEVTPAQLRAAGWSILIMTMYAYEIRPYQIVCPEWIRTELYDVWAKLPEGTKKEETHAMVRNLLAERFKLTTHWVIREGPAYELVLRPSGLKLKPSSEGEPRKTLISMGGYVYAQATTLTQFCDILAPHLQRPVLDRTSTEGRFDITIQPGPDFIRLAIPGESTSMPSGSQVPEAPLDTSLYPELKALGLELRSIRASVKYLVIDSVQKDPTAN